MWINCNLTAETCFKRKICLNGTHTDPNVCLKIIVMWENLLIFVRRYKKKNNKKGSTSHNEPHRFIISKSPFQNN